MSEINNNINFEGTHLKLIQEIKDNEGIVLLAFYSTWCHHCKKLQAALADFFIDYPKVTFIQVNVDKNQQSAISFGVKSIPQVFIIKSEDEGYSTLDSISGYEPAKIKEALDNAN